MGWSDVSQLWLLAQEAGKAVGNEAAKDGAGGLFQYLANPMVPFILILFVFMFLMMPSERRRRAEQNKMLENLKKNDRIVSIGGIVGTVVNVQKGDEFITVRIDENTRVSLLRTAIARVLTDTDNNKKDKSE